MAACDPLTFTDVSPEKWACLKAAIAADGHVIMGDAGEAETQGVTLTWAYDAEAKSLTIQCTKHLFILPCAVVNARIKSLYEHSDC